MKVYETAVEINPKFMRIYFLENVISYDLRKSDKAFLSPSRLARYEINSLLLRDSPLWNTVWYKGNN